jgi:RimJ/RimL family protein N-acetyltransferase
MDPARTNPEWFGVINARRLMQLHVEALFTCDDAGRLVVVNEPGGNAAPRFFLGRTADGNAWWFRHDVAAGLVSDLDALCESLPMAREFDAGLDTAAQLLACLTRDGPVCSTWSGPAYNFPTDPSVHESAVRVTPDNATVLSPYLEDWCNDVASALPMTAVLHDGKAVSVCGSVRITPQAHEAGVETHPYFRGRGYGARVVAAWATAVDEMARVPLYSTFWDNEPSRALAKKLGLMQYGVDLHFT